MNFATVAQAAAHKNVCLSGIAKMSIRCGDTRRGVAIAMENDSSRSLRRECAEILESIKVKIGKYIIITADR